MAIDLFKLLKKCKIFSSLDDAALKKLITKFDRIHLDDNETLFRQGAASDHLYLLVSGRLIVILKTDTDERKIIGEIEAGRTIGELGALSNEPRSATVKALEPSILLKLSGAEFKTLCHDYPSVILETLNTLAYRSRNLMQMLSVTEQEKKHIAIIAANKKSSLAKFLEKITVQLSDTSGITILSDANSEAVEGHRHDNDLEQRIDELENKKQTILYFLESAKSSLAHLAFENAEKIYVVANSNSKPFINELVLEKINEDKSLRNRQPELILFYEEEVELPKKTIKWLRLQTFALHHHIRLYLESDCQRILRFMRGKAFGLVLGGGGVRSWAHLGVIKALEESNIPIDAIGGTSAGAIVAGHYALHVTHKDDPGKLQELSAVTRETVSFKNLTWPAVSVFNGKAYTQKLKDIFGSIRMEDLWLPCFCIACNLADNSQVIYKRGPLWKKIRSSTAVPAIFPPVVVKGDLHLDGGILNNLPVDVMKKLIGGTATIIASELTHKNNGNTKYNFPPVLPFWQTATAKMGIAFKDFKFPHFVDTFLKSLLAGSSVKQQENSLLANVLISPDLSHYSLLNVSKVQEGELVELGYQATVTALKKWEEKKANKEKENNEPA